MAFGSWRSASMTFSTHSWNWTMGSGSRSALSRPARVYSLRRFEASTSSLPAPGAGDALERADYVRGDPTPVEIPFLRLDLLPPNPASIHPGRVEGDVVFEAGERRRRVGIVPGGTFLGLLLAGYLVLCGDVVVAGTALPFAQRSVARPSQKLHLDV